jgi:hypothetical protein
LGAISHEIAHKFLHTNSISWGGGPADHYHNEVLTDIAGVLVSVHVLEQTIERQRQADEDHCA